jgi:hypothetical protein
MKWYIVCISLVFHFKHLGSSSKIACVEWNFTQRSQLSQEKLLTTNKSNQKYMCIFAHVFGLKNCARVY